MQILRLAVADDHEILLEGLVSLIKPDTHEMQVVLTALNGNTLLEGLQSVKVDVILLDLNMHGGHGLDVLPSLKELYPEVKVVIFTMYDNPKFIKEAFRLGADGYVLKSTSLQHLTEGLKEVASGQIYLSTGLTVFPGGNGSADKFSDEFLMIHNLTRRELEILVMIAQAKSSKDIADELYISDQTVSVHRKNLMRKLNISNSAGLMKFVIEHELM